jgi:death-on-curing protein
LHEEPNWLPVDVIIETNEDEVRETREPHFLRDPDALESACQRPLNYYVYEGQDDIVSLATVLLVGICEAHAFEQGNKRTGLTCALMFIESNGYATDFGQDTEWLGQIVEDVIAKRESQETLEEALRDCTFPALD